MCMGPGGEGMVVALGPKTSVCTTVRYGTIKPKAQMIKKKTNMRHLSVLLRVTALCLSQFKDFFLKGSISACSNVLQSMYTFLFKKSSLRFIIISLKATV